MFKFDIKILLKINFFIYKNINNFQDIYLNFNNNNITIYLKKYIKNMVFLKKNIK